ncbi:hypothetical protein J2S44_000402 [Catenuloplanes niger]|uniref:Uncharacterized protein n=1 Tax=Catenuloplanes niger TaxID=587534 RepID=A0AAE3ZHN8_9ACTN|nr:hypothetical protein [Catenuloplanes niger]
MSGATPDRSASPDDGVCGTGPAKAASDAAPGCDPGDAGLDGTPPEGATAASPVAGGGGVTGRAQTDRGVSTTAGGISLSPPTTSAGAVAAIPGGAVGAGAAAEASAATDEAGASADIGGTVAGPAGTITGPLRGASRATTGGVVAPAGTGASVLRSPGAETASADGSNGAGEGPGAVMAALFSDLGCRVQRLSPRPHRTTLARTQRAAGWGCRPSRWAATSPQCVAVRGADSVLSGAHGATDAGGSRSADLGGRPKAGAAARVHRSSRSAQTTAKKQSGRYAPSRNSPSRKTICAGQRPGRNTGQGATSQEATTDQRAQRSAKRQQSAGRSNHSGAQQPAEAASNRPGAQQPAAA